MPHFDGTGPKGRRRQFGLGNGCCGGSGVGCGLGYGRRQRNHGQGRSDSVPRIGLRRGHWVAMITALRTEIQALREQLDTLMSRSEH